MLRVAIQQTIDQGGGCLGLRRCRCAPVANVVKVRAAVPLPCDRTENGGVIGLNVRIFHRDAPQAEDLRKHVVNRSFLSSRPPEDVGQRQEGNRPPCGADHGKQRLGLVALNVSHVGLASTGGSLARRRRHGGP